MPGQRLIGAVSALVCVAWAGIPAAAAEQATPNVVLIMTDDQGWWDLSCHGHPTLETPHLDRLASESVEFMRFYASPVCTPTRASLMTGRHYQRTGAIDTYRGLDTLDTSEVTLAEMFQRKGYTTAQTGKWHLGRYARYHPMARGFDEYFGFWQYGYINRYFDSDELWHNREPVVTKGYVTDVLTDQAIRFIQSHPDAPFFLYVPYNAPHFPHLAPDDLIEKYLGKDLPLREARIAAMIDSIDQNVGRILAALDANDLVDDTVVIFMSDNGGVSRSYKAGLRGNKGSTYEGGIRVPFFARWPGQFPAGAKVGPEVMGQHIDLFPTLCELIGVDPPSGVDLDGKSLLSILRAGKGESPREYAFHQWCRARPDPDKSWAVQSVRYKLVNGELFDMKNDPGETKNLAEAHPDIAKKLHDEFMRWFNDVTDRDYGRVPIEVGRADENPVEVDISWADFEGKAKYGWGSYHRDHIGGWTTPEDRAMWKLDVVRSGTYRVRLAYGAHPDVTGQQASFDIADENLIITLEPRAGAMVYEAHEVGAIQLEKGPVTLTIAPSIPMPEDQAQHGHLRLHKIWLERAE